MADYTLDDTGLSIPAMVDIIAALDADFVSDEGYGPGVDLTPNSPLYKLSRPFARQIALCWQGLRDFVGQLDPATAVGQQLDYLGSIIGIERRGATHSTIAGRAIGAPGTPISDLAVLRYLPTGSLWQVSDAATIGAGGIVTIDLEAQDFGPVDAAIGGTTDWEIVTGGVIGWTGFESTAAAARGRDVEEDPDYRVRLLEASRGLATYDAIVRELRETQNVSNVYLYINLGLGYDPVKKLFGKQMRPVLEGGSKADIIAALHRSVGAPVETVGAVEGTYDPGNGQILDYAFDRVVRRRGYLKLTITGGNPGVPLPADAAALALAAVGKVVPAGGQPFSPFVFGVAAVAALPPGSVTKLKAEGRLDPGDPWVEDAIPLDLFEVIEVATTPQPARGYAVEEDAIFIGIGDDFDYKVNGGVLQSYTFLEVVTQSSVAAKLLHDDASEPVSFSSVDGRLYVETDDAGATKSIEIVSGTAALYLFGAATTFVGTDGDATIVIVP